MPADKKLPTSAPPANESDGTAAAMVDATEGSESVLMRVAETWLGSSSWRRSAGMSVLPVELSDLVVAKYSNPWPLQLKRFIKYLESYLISVLSALPA